MTFGDVWRSSLRYRLAYGVAVALTAIVSIELVLFLYEGVDPEYYGSFIQDIREFSGLSLIIVAGGFLAGAATWYPPGRHEPPIDMLRLVGTMIGLAFWLPGLMTPIIVWLAYPDGLANSIGKYVAMALYGCVAGGIFGAFVFGPAAYLIGTVFLASMRHLEWSMSPPAVVGTTSGGRPRRIVNATVAALALLAASITLLSVLYYAGKLIHAGTIGLLALF